MFKRFNHCFSTSLRAVAAALVLAAVGNTAAASVMHVSIDTSGFGVTNGYIDMQLSASAGVPLAVATVDKLVGFNTAGFIDAFGVTAVPGGYQFRNDTSNDLYHAATFGSNVSFDVDFEGDPDPSTTYISHFVVAAFDSDGNPLGDYDPFNLGLLDLSWTPSISGATSGSLAIARAAPNVAAVPEPACWLLFGAGLGSIALARRRRTPGASGLKAKLGFGRQLPA